MDNKDNKAATTTKAEADNTDARETLDKIADMLQIGILARSPQTILENVRNALRRDDCLSAVEREFFMVPMERDEDSPEDDPGEECLLNWGADPAAYVEQFRAALASRPQAGAAGASTSVQSVGGSIDTPERRELQSAVTMVCNMLERDGTPVRAEAAEVLRNVVAAHCACQAQAVPADGVRDAALLDRLDQWRKSASSDGSCWASVHFNLSKPVREQLDAALDKAEAKAALRSTSTQDSNGNGEKGGA